MKPDTAEIRLDTVKGSPESIYSISTSLTAVLTARNSIDKNTLIFDCNPIGDNYRRTYLQVTFGDWSVVAKIRDFLAHHFSDMKGTRRTLNVPIDQSHYSIHPESGGESGELEGFEEITVTADGSRVEFGGMAPMTPNIYTYEEIDEDGEPKDDNNATKLLNFLNEITSEHPISCTAFDLEAGEEDNSRDIYRLFNQHSVFAQLHAITDPDNRISQDYQKAVREFKDGEYNDSIRDVGRAAEELIERVCKEIYPEEDIPDSTGGRINKLDKSESGLPAFIGKAVSPLWWLRNKANHPTEYDITKGDAHYALLCFQATTEKYVEDYLNADIDY